MMQFYVEDHAHKVAFYRIPMGFWYLATPYSKWPGGLNDAAAHAAALTARLLEVGIYTFSPICHSHAVALHSTLDPKDHAIWMPLDEQFMHAAFGLLVADLAGWQDSHGVCEEIKWFNHAKKPVNLLSLENLSVQSLSATQDDLHQILQR